MYDGVSYIGAGGKKEEDKLKTCKLDWSNLHVFSLSTSFSSPSSI
jgi:hypothetical protein